MEIKVTKETIRKKLKELDDVDRTIGLLVNGTISENRFPISNGSDINREQMGEEAFQIWLNGALEAKRQSLAHLKAQRIALQAELGINSEE